MRNCFCCDKKLHLDYDDEIKESSNYDNATCWTSSGAWCSQVFDGLMDEFIKLEIVICDECLKKKIETTYGWLKVTTYADEKFMGRPVITKEVCGEFKRYKED